MELLRKTAVMRVEAQTKDKAPDTVTTISLSGVPVSHALIEPFTHLTHLYFVATKPKLTSLTALQLSHFPHLRLLDVSDNAVKVDVSPTEAPCTSLKRLLMPNNMVSSLDEVRRLADAFPQLEILDLYDNPVMTDGVFDAVFGAFVSLAALNSKTRDGTEVVVEDSDESDSSSEEEESEDDDEEGSTTSSAEDLDDADSDAGEEPAQKKHRPE